MSPSEIQQQFDRIALLSQEQWDHNSHYHRHLLRHVPPRIESALDTGCGMGTFSRLLAARSNQVLGIDLSPEMIRAAKERSADYPNIEYQVADILNYDLPSAHFDCIASIATLHHLPVEAVLHKMKAALKPGGVLLILDLFQSTHGDMLRNLLAAPTSIFLKLIKNGKFRDSAALQEAWAEHGKGDTYPTMQQVRRLCAAHLPGAKVRQHLLWRYSVIWWRNDTPALRL